MFDIFLIAAAVIGIVIYNKAKAHKHPIRLTELEQALRTHADLRLHRNKDIDASNRFRRLAQHLETARYLVNSPVKSWHQEWMAIRVSLFECTSEGVLSSVDLFYTDRREEIKSAVYDLVSRLEKAYESKSR